MLNISINTILAKQIWADLKKSRSHGTIAELISIINDLLPNDANEMHCREFFNGTRIEIFHHVKNKIEMIQKINELKEKIIFQKNQLIDQRDKLRSTREVISYMFGKSNYLQLKLNRLQDNIDESLNKIIDCSLGIKTIYDPLDHHISFDKLCELEQEYRLAIPMFHDQYTKLLISIPEMLHISQTKDSMLIPRLIIELSKFPSIFKDSNKLQNLLIKKFKQSTQYHFKKLLKKNLFFNKIDSIKLSESLSEIHPILIMINSPPNDPHQLIHKIKTLLHKIHHLEQETKKDFFKRLFTLQPNYFSWVKSFKKIISHHELHIFSQSRDNHLSQLTM